MAKTYFPFDAGAGANVTEAQWREMAEFFLRSGVIKGELNGLEAYGDSSGLQVKVRTGKAFIKGHYFKSDAEETLAISSNSSGNPRIDRVVLRADFTANTIDFAVLTGTPAGSPKEPTLTQSSTTWEVSLAKVAVANGAATITAGNVTDERSYARAVDIPTLTTAQRDALPSSVKTEGMVIYNDTTNQHEWWTGSAWSALGGNITSDSSTVITAEGTTSTTYTDLATAGPSVTATIGASGKALVLYSCDLENSLATVFTAMSFAVSGATTVTTSDDWRAAATVVAASAVQTVSRARLVTGLTPGSNTFTMKYRVASGTGTFHRRHMVVLPL